MGVVVIALARRKDKRIFEIPFDGYWVACSLDTKRKIDELFIQAGYVKSTTPIIISGVRMVSLVEFNKSNIEYTKMIVLTKTGIDKVNQLCAGLKNKIEIRNQLLRYFVPHFESCGLDKSRLDLNLISMLADHYLKYHNSSIYTHNELGRCICLLYPMTKYLREEFNVALNKIVTIREDSIVKDRIHFV